MQIYDAAFSAALTGSRDAGIRPAWFVWVLGRDRETGADRPLGLWSGDEDILLTLPQPDGTTATRTYVGGCNLTVPNGIPYVADLTDNPVTVAMSQIADAAQLLVRGYDVRLAYAEVHATSWYGGALVSDPQLMFAGIVDEAPISTPAAGSEGGISMTIRSEIMTQLTAVNPAKSSDTHQKRRKSNDAFCKYAGTIKSRKIQWFKD